MSARCSFRMASSGMAGPALSSFSPAYVHGQAPVLHTLQFYVGRPVGTDVALPAQSAACTSASDNAAAATALHAAPDAIVVRDGEGGTKEPCLQAVEPAAAASRPALAPLRGSASLPRSAAGLPDSSPLPTFRLQQQAFDWLDQQPSKESLRVFAEETAEDGRRRFLVAAPAKFWQVYELLPPTQRHHYEIIRQGSPCHLYFDLEFVPAFNPALDGDSMVEALLEVVDELLQECFRIKLRREWVLELDSSTSSKFSRHVILHIRRAAFADNSHVNAFVGRVVERILELGRTQPRFASFKVSKGPQRAADGAVPPPPPGAGVAHAAAGAPSVAELFIDTGVYTRNRAFRLFLSSKYGKTATLLATNRFGYGALAETAVKPGAAAAGPLASGETQPAIVIQAGSQPTAMDREVFFATLTCQVDPCSRLLRMYKPGEQLGTTSLPGFLPGGVRNASTCGETDPAGQRGTAAACHGASRFPAVDKFIESVCNQGGVQGQIRSWLAVDANTLLFNIKHNRWCGNVNAAHRSNGIYFLVDIGEGTWCQRCYDPCCREYRSERMPLPRDVWESVVAEKHEAAMGVGLAVPSAAPAGATAEGAFSQRQDVSRARGTTAAPDAWVAWDDDGDDELLLQACL